MLKRLFPTAALTLMSTTALGAGPAWKRLNAEQASASSYLQSNWNKYDENYHPSYALDGNPKTAWVEGVDGNGEGQTLSIPVSDIKTARAVRLRIFNGYQKSAALLDANAAPAEVTIVVRDAGGDVVGTQQARLKKALGPQEIVVAIEQGRGVASITLRVDSTHPGRVYKDGCLSDVEVFVDSDVPYVETVEAQKRAALKAWIRGRAAAAKAFASIKPGYPFAATHFKLSADIAWQNEETRVYVEAKDVWTDIAGKQRLDVQIKAGKPSGIVADLFSPTEWASLVDVQGLAADQGLRVATTWQRVDVSHAHPLPDGFEELTGFLPSLAAVASFFDLSSLTFFEAQGEAGGSSRSKTRGDSDWVRTWTTTNARVSHHADHKTPRQVYFSEHRVISEREVIDETDHYLLDFDEGGHLVRVRRIGNGSGSMFASVVDVDYDAAGKVRSLRQRSVSGGNGDEAEWDNNASVSTKSFSIVAADHG